MARVQPDPPGIEPNWTDWEVIGYMVLLGLMTFFFSLRCYAKITLRQPLQIEDWCCSISWILSVLEIAISFKMVQYGLTQPADQLSPEQDKNLHKWLYAVSLVYGPAVLATKLTLLVILDRLFSIHPIMAFGIRLFIHSMLIFYFVLLIMKAFVCTPVSAFWDTELLAHGGHCMNQTVIFIADTSFAIVTDAAILVLPIFLAVSLRISFLRKLKLMVMLGAGGVAVGVTIYRAVLIVAFQYTKNITQDFATILFYCLVEVALGQICACLPFTNLLLKRRANESNRRSLERYPYPLTKVGSRSSIRQRLKSLDSTFAHFHIQRMSSSVCDESPLSPKRCSSNTEPTTHALESSHGQPMYCQNRAPGPNRTSCQVPFPSRVVTSMRMGTAEQAYEAAVGPGSSPPVDDWYWRDLEGGRGLPGDAEPPPPPQPSAATMLRTPSEILVPNRIVS